MKYLVIAACLLLGSAHAHADEAATSDQPRERFFLRAGPTFATFDTTATVAVAGAQVPGAQVGVGNNTGFSIEGGYYVRPNWSVSLTIGVPPTAKIYGAGTLSSAGLLGTVVYGPSALGIQYHPATRGRFQPYIGAGYDFTLVYHERGSSIGNLHVGNGDGPVVQAGVEYRVSPHWAFFVDAKKIWVAVNATGTIASAQGNQPAFARLALDPVIGSTGVSWHF